MISLNFENAACYVCRTPGNRGFIPWFFFWTLAGYALLHAMPESFFSMINQSNARACTVILNQMGIAAVRTGELIRFQGFTARVVGECSAVFISVLPLAFFLSFPARPLLRAAGILIGLPTLFALNIIRIVIVFIVGFSSPALFSWVHLYLGQVGMILAVVGICLVWLRAAGGMTDIRSALGFLLKAMALSILPFLAWIWLCRPYTWLVLNLSAFILKSAGFPVTLPETLEIYPHTFVTFNIVIMASLMLADRLQGRRTSLKLTAAVFFLLFILHCCFQALPFLFFQHRIQSSQHLINAMLLLHQFVLPFGFWVVLWLSRRQHKTGGPSAPG